LKIGQSCDPEFTVGVEDDLTSIGRDTRGKCARRNAPDRRAASFAIDKDKLKV
jgi:hypothetical protein